MKVRLGFDGGRWEGGYMQGRRSKLLFSSLYYLGDYPPRLGLEKEIWFKKRF